MSIYDCELWDNTLHAACDYNSFAVNYHKSIKKCMKVPWRCGNNDIREEAGLPIFKHFINHRLTSFVFNIMKYFSPNFLLYKNYFLLESHVLKY